MVGLKTKSRSENLKKYDDGLAVAEAIVHCIRRRAPHSINGQYFNILEIREALEALEKMRELTKK